MASYEEFKKNLQIIPEIEVSTNHLERAYKFLIRISNNFEVVDQKTLTTLMNEDGAGLDLLRFILRKSGARFASDLEGVTGIRSFKTLQSRVLQNRELAKRVANFVLINFKEELEAELEIAKKGVTFLDILIERYVEKRDIGLKGQQRGNVLEIKVLDVLETIGLVLNRDFFRRKTVQMRFIEKGNEVTVETDKIVDFVIPKPMNPAIVIETKAYGYGGGSKIADAIGDVRKISNPIMRAARADSSLKPFFFLVIDGRHVNTIAKAIFQLRDDGEISGIYQVATLPLLQDRIKEILGIQ